MERATSWSGIEALGELTAGCRRITRRTWAPWPASDGLACCHERAQRPPIPVQERADELAAEQTRVLEFIARGRPLGACLRALTGAASRLSASVRACVVTASLDRTRIGDACSAQLPASFTDRVRGLPLGEEAIGTCGAAIGTGQTVLCADVARSGAWSSAWRALCLDHGIAACLSTPVFAADGRAIASFFLCLPECREPTPWERRIAEFGAQLASIALERARAEQSLRDLVEHQAGTRRPP